MCIRDRNTSKYTAKSVAAMQKALSNAKVVLNNEAATEEEVKSAVEALEASIQNLETKTATAKKSGSTSRNVSNTYGAAGVVSASQSAAASVRSDAANEMCIRDRLRCPPRMAGPCSCGYTAPFEPSAFPAKAHLRQRLPN